MASDSSPVRPLRISGLPGVGKTEFVRWLANRGWGTFFGDDPDASGAQLHAAWDLAISGDDQRLLAEAAKYPTAFAIECGFPAGHIGTVAG